MISRHLQTPYYHSRFSNYREILSTFNAILCVAGFQFFAIIAGDSGLTTLYLAIHLAISVITIIVTYGKHTKINTAIEILFVYWVLLVMRFYYDMYIRLDIPYIDPSIIHSHERLMFRTILPAVALITGFYYINFKKLLGYSFYLITFGAIYAYFSNDAFQLASDTRSYINESFGTLVTGHFGVVSLILCAVVFFNTHALWKKLYILGVIIISALILLRSGSRGPLFALMMVGLIWFYANSKSDNSTKALLFLGVVLAVVLQDVIIDVISLLSPVIVQRFEQHSEDGGQLSDRLELWMQAWEAFKGSPIIGEYFGLYRPEWAGKFYWCHNAFVDTIMQLGIVGALLFITMCVKLFKASVKLLRERNEAFWIGLLAVESISKIMFSYAFYTDPFVTHSLVLIYLLADSSIRNRICQKKNFL